MSGGVLTCVPAAGCPVHLLSPTRLDLRDMHRYETDHTKHVRGDLWEVVP